LFFESLLSKSSDNFNLNILLTDRKVYYFVDEKLKQKGFDVENYYGSDSSHLWGSQFYDSKKRIYLVNAEKELNLSLDFANIKDFDNFLFDKFTYHNIKAALYFKESIDTRFKFEIYTLFNAASKDYSYALKSWLISNFIKNEYKINSDLIVNYFLFFIFLLENIKINNS